MPILNRLGNGLGLLALAVSLALASPGVKVVRAETVAADAAPEQCNAALRRQSHDAKTDAFIEGLRLKHGVSRVNEAGAPAEDAQRFIVLNNRGYNYGPAPGVAVDGILADIEARRR
jgi:hypothetical protein